jgi:RNA recognition motif-containing protein
MSTEVDSNLFDNSLSAISEVDRVERSINTYSNDTNMRTEPSTTDHDNTMNDLSRNDTMNDGQSNVFDESSQQINAEDESQSRQETNAARLNNDTQEYGDSQDRTNGESRENESSQDPTGDQQNDDSQQEQSDEQKNRVLEPEQFRKVFIGGLSYKTENETLRDYFSKYGELVDYVVMKDNHTNKPKGFGFVCVCFKLDSIFLFISGFFVF